MIAFLVGFVILFYLACSFFEEKSDCNNLKEEEEKEIDDEIIAYAIINDTFNENEEEFEDD